MEPFYFRICLLCINKFLTLIKLVLFVEIMEVKSFVKEIKHDGSLFHIEGPYKALDMKDGKFIFKNNIRPFYSDSQVILQKKNDFELYFTKFDIVGPIFSCELILVFSPAVLQKFLGLLKETLEKMSNLKTLVEQAPTEEISENMPTNKNDEKKGGDVNTNKGGTLLKQDFTYFSPNAFFLYDVKEKIQFYFGRKLGDSNESKFQLFFHSVIIPEGQLNELIEIIEKNFKSYEEKYTSQSKNSDTNKKDEVAKSK